MGIKKSQIGVAVGQTPSPIDLSEQSPPTTESNKVRLYSKDVSGAAEFFVRDDVGNEVQMTDGGSVPGSGGGFPPIAFWGDMWNNPQIASAGCSYIHTCTASSNGRLSLPVSPADGDEVGFFRLCGAYPITICGCGKIIQRPDRLPACSCSTTVTYSIEATVIRYSQTRDQWETVQGGFEGAPPLPPLP
jgi:hypothetical protein